MAQPLDILDERDPVGAPFLGSVTVHIVIIGIVFMYWYWSNRPKDNLGDPNPAAGVSVSAVSTIPIPRREAAPNPVANDSESSVRTAPSKQETEKKPPPDKDAVEIADRTKPKKLDNRPLKQQQYMQPAPDNQIYSQTRQAVSSPMYGGPAGAGQVGIGPNSPLGNRLGWYAELVRQRLAQNWKTSGLGQRNPAIVSFVIVRDGSIRDIKVFQSSGDPSVDNSALRAVYDSNPLPALPSQAGDNSITAQFTFNLR